MYRIIRRGIAAGEIRPDADPALVNEVLVGPLTARMWAATEDGLDPVTTSRRLVDFVYAGIAAR
jgi:hypothetical protein